MRRPVIAGNWKMNKTIDQAVDFVEKLKPQVAGVAHCDIVVAPPFTALRSVCDAAKHSNIRVAAQDVHWDKEGAHTGDVSTAMLVDTGCTHVIIGHSERRQHHGETDERVNQKVKAALAAGLIPLVCVGESLTQREAAETRAVLDKQFRGGVAGLTPAEFSRIILAYEPVWAIGTGRTATPDTAAQSHRYLRQLAREKFGESQADGLRILYGGSVKSDNMGGLMAQDEIDGALVGGASLQVESFLSILRYRQSPRAF